LYHNRERRLTSNVSKHFPRQSLRCHPRLDDSEDLLFTTITQDHLSLAAAPVARNGHRNTPPENHSEERYQRDLPCSSIHLYLDLSPSTRSNDIGVPRLTAHCARRPRIWDKCFGASPNPGRIARTFACVNFSPAPISATTYSERRK